MRYYAINIQGANGTVFPPVPGCDVPGAQFATVAYGKNDPGALRCEMYIEQNFAHTPNINSFVRLWGVNLNQIGQTSNLNGLAIDVFGGMYPGLPLASKQSVYRGRLVSGTIQAAFGNWQGTDISLDLLLSPGTSTSTGTGTYQPSNLGSGQSSVAPSNRLLTRPTQSYTKIGNKSVPVSTRPSPIPLDIFSDASSAASGALSGIANLLGDIAKTFGGGGWNNTPVNLIHNLEANTPLSSGIQQTLSTAFPNSNVNININSALQLSYADKGYYQSAQQAFGYWKSLSQSILGTNGYYGVVGWADGKNINVLDFTSQGVNKTIHLDYYDLIGKPTWLDVVTISIKSVMRSDINPGDIIILPADIPVTISVPTDSTFIGLGLQSLTLGFTGSFSVINVLHVGDSRHPDGAQWCTVLQCVTSSSVSGSLSQTLTSTTTTDIGSYLPSFSTSSKLTKRKIRRYG